MNKKTHTPRAQTEHKTFTVNKRKLDVLTVGNPEHPPILFLHGYAANPHIYIKSLAKLASQQKYVIAPALPSFAKSQSLPIFQQTVEGIAEHLHVFLTENYSHIEKHEIVGHSFGGGIALRYAAKYPENTKSLILINPVGGAGEGAIKFYHIWFGLLSGDAGKQWVLNGLKHFLPVLISNMPGIIVSGLSAWFSDQINDIKMVDNADIPTRIYFSNQDKLVKPGLIPSMTTKNINVQTRDGKHSWLIDDPQKFVELILDTTHQPDMV